MTVTLAGPSTEETFAEVLAELVDMEEVPADSHFFDDLGADSMVMAQFCARVRKRGDLPHVSMKDIYAHPTLEGLAASLADDTTALAEPPIPAPAEAPAPEPPGPSGTPRYVVCGALQALVVLAYFYGAALVITAGYEWISAGSGAIEVYLRSVLVGAAGFLGACAVPILAKWMLIGRWKPQRIPVWSLAYLRFWVVKTLVQRNPLVLFAGTPVYALYLRALGAKVGRGALILSRRTPVCTDLLTVGDGAVIRKDSFFTCYRAEGGVIETGAVTLGRNVVVGEAAVLDIDTSMGDGAQLGHTSSLHAGQAVPAGERRHGSPAERRTEVDYRAFEAAGSSTARGVVYSVLQLLRLLILTLPLAIGGLAVLVAEVPALRRARRRRPAVRRRRFLPRAAPARMTRPSWR